MIATDAFEKVEVSSSEELATWLSQYHQQKESIWLVTYKKNVPEKYVSISSVLDLLISYGWIDGIRRKLDEERTMQLIAPRRVTHWAKSYKERAEKLIVQGRMQESGFQAIQFSKEIGMWDYMEEVDAGLIPSDLQEVLLSYSGATEFFNRINESSKRFVLRWIKLAKTEKTRSSRIKQIAQLAAEGKKLKGS